MSTVRKLTVRNPIGIMMDHTRILAYFFFGKRHWSSLWLYHITVPSVRCVLGARLWIILYRRWEKNYFPTLICTCMNGSVARHRQNQYLYLRVDTAAYTGSQLSNCLRAAQTKCSHFLTTHMSVFSILNDKCAFTYMRENKKKGLDSMFAAGFHFLGKAYTISRRRHRVSIVSLAR